MKELAEKTLNAILSLVKGVAIIILVLLALVYVMDLNSIGSSSLIIRDSKVYSDPAAGLSSDITLGGCTVVEQIGEPNNYGYTKIRYDTSSIGYVRSGNLLDVSALTPLESNDTTRIVKVDPNNIEFDDMLEDEVTIKIIRELVSLYEDTAFAGVYVSLEDASSWSQLTTTLENLHIPYGYFLECRKFDDSDEISEFVSENLVNLENEYNILPLTVDVTGSDFYVSELKNSFSDDVAFYGVNSGNNYWTISSEEFMTNLEFRSKNNFAIEFENENTEEYISLVKLNHESLLYETFLTKYNSLIEIK